VQSRGHAPRSNLEDVLWSLKLGPFLCKTYPTFMHFVLFATIPIVIERRSYRQKKRQAQFRSFEISFHACESAVYLFSQWDNIQTYDRRFSLK